MTPIIFVHQNININISHLQPGEPLHLVLANVRPVQQPHAETTTCIALPQGRAWSESPAAMRASSSKRSPRMNCTHHLVTEGPCSRPFRTAPEAGLALAAVLASAAAYSAASSGERAIAHRAHPSATACSEPVRDAIVSCGIVSTSSPSDTALPSTGPCESAFNRYGDLTRDCAGAGA